MLDSRIIQFDEIDSTNTEAVRMLDKMPKSGTVIVANRQTNGVGKLDRQFESHSGGLYMSYIVREADMLVPLGLVTSVVGVAVVECVKQVSGLDVRIKWPNDIVCDRGKLCGILTLKKGEFIIVGIGLNVMQVSFSPQLENIATSIHMLTGENYCVQSTLEILLDRLDEMLIKEFCKDELIKKLRASSDTIGKNVILALSTGQISGLAVDIADTGALIVEVDGVQKEIYSAELI